MVNQKAFKPGDKVLFQCPITKDILYDEIAYIGQNTIEGVKYDLSYMYITGKLTKVNK